MNNNYIEFKKKRELGDILTDVFVFLRTNFKPLFTVLFKTTGIVLVILLLSIAYYTHATSNFMDPFALGGGAGNLNMFNSGSFLISAFVMIISILIFYGLVFGTVLHYIKEYSDNQGVVLQQSVINGVKKDLGSIIGLSILSSIMLVVGFMLCVIPGIYLYVPLSLIFPILVFRKSAVFDTISESFELVKNEWWITFATLLVIGLLSYVISMVFSIPAIMYTFFKTFTAASEGSFSDPSSMFDWVFILLNTIASVLQYIIIYLFTAISTAFIYFNLNERKHHTGTLEQIDSLGKTE
ncbi:hypothetical protein J8L88_15425 [Aquimarina sp. MMG015]|uniref:hypothetical protein n=1 Tax=Aquimarina TaxID=290174 RepID=UPI00041C196A|nr:MULTISPECIES: hypothetical protein [Aquimarina]AXT54219.1 hypothetical protein D1815_00125 [Aquimarina sp. AD1]MBQ4804254.1 hypothetical protein [Aquimarina sp. MMG015]RKN25097.1 hypothetical protein D7035_10285 [Aquimarina sp. AD1]